VLSWSIYALCRYPGNQERLYEEIAQHVANDQAVSGTTEPKRWTYAEIHGLKFLDAFLKEVLRLHAPSYQTSRNAKQDVVLPGGYLIPKGSVVITNFTSIHKNDKYWDNPLQFYPDRWLEDEKLAARMTKEGSFTPFASGGRSCVGLNLALAQAKLSIVELVRRYSFEDESPEAVVYDPEWLVVRPLNFYAGFTKRET
jgi:cytochrome P450